MKAKQEYETHESYGMIDIAKFTGKREFFGSDIIQNGGINIVISKASVERDLSTEWFHAEEEIISVEMSSNQFIDAITSGMNTAGIPCTIKHINGKRMQQIDHVIDKKQTFRNELINTHKEYFKKIDSLIELASKPISKKEQATILKDLGILRNHIASNTNYVMDCFNENMEKTVTEAKQSVSNYIDHKIHSLGLETIRKELSVSIENQKEIK